MDIDIFTLCDFAQDYNGKLTVVGTFDTIFSKSYPTKHPSCSLACRLRFQKSEEGEHSIAIHIIDEDGNRLIKPLIGKIKVKTREGLLFSTTNFVITISNLKVEKRGQYRIDLLIDGKSERSIPLLAVGMQE